MLRRSLHISFTLTCELLLSCPKRSISFHREKSFASLSRIPHFCARDPCLSNHAEHPPLLSKPASSTSWTAFTILKAPPTVQPARIESKRILAPLRHHSPSRSVWPHFGAEISHRAPMLVPLGSALIQNESYKGQPSRFWSSSRSGSWACCCSRPCSSSCSASCRWTIQTVHADLYWEGPRLGPGPSRS